MNPYLKALAGMRAILDSAGDRPLTQSQAKDFLGHYRAASSAAGIDAQENAIENLSADSGNALAKTFLSKLQEEATKPLPRKTRTESIGARGYGTFEGNESKLLRPDQSIAGKSRHSTMGDADIPASAFIKGIVTGDWGSYAPEAKAMSVGTVGAGGYLVPAPLSDRWIDKARNAAKVIQAGALTYPMTTATEKFARVTGDPTAGWKSENAAITASDMTLDAVTLTARTLTCMVKVSVELIEDANPQADDVIEGAIAKVMALELDRAALYGSGTPPEPRGVRNASGIWTVSMGTNGATIADYSQLVTAVVDIKSSNFEPNAYIISPRTEGELDQLSDDVGQLRPVPQSVRDLTRLVTSQVSNAQTQGTSSVASDIFVGEWDQMVIGVRTQLTLEASRQAADTVAGDSAWMNLQVWLRAYLRADIAVLQPKAFAVVEGLL